MKIVLVHPPYWESFFFSSPSPPLGLGYIGAVLEKSGFDVQIIDSNPLRLTLDGVKNAIKNEKPDIVGIDCGTTYRYEAFDLVRLLKGDMPEIITVMGGPHVTFTAEETLARIPEIDVIVRGEGEMTMLELAKSIKQGRNYRDIEGITFRENGNIVSSPNRLPLADLDTLPFSALHLFPLDKYDPEEPRKELRKLRYCPIITSRGCTIGCVFCSTCAFWGRKFRARSANNILDELRFRINEYGAGHFQFFDDAFAMNQRRAKEVCQEIIDQDLKIKFHIMARADNMDEELINLLQKAGCYQIDFGVETGSPAIMKNIGKKLDLSVVEKTFKMCREVGINVLAYFMAGLPGEREADIQRTIEFIKRAEIDTVDAFVASVFPGTELYHKAESSGAIDSSVWFTYKAAHGEGRLRDAPPYLEYFSAKRLNHFVKLMNYEGWKKRGLIFYYQKKVRTIFTRSAVKLVRSSVLLAFLWEGVKKLIKGKR